MSAKPWRPTSADRNRIAALTALVFASGRLSVHQSASERRREWQECSSTPAAGLVAECAQAPARPVASTENQIAATVVSHSNARRVGVRQRDTTVGALGGAGGAGGVPPPPSSGSRPSGGEPGSGYRTERGRHAGPSNTAMISRYGNTVALPGTIIGVSARATRTGVSRSRQTATLARLMMMQPGY